MGANNQLQVPLVGVGGTSPYTFNIVTGPNTTIPATIASGVLTVDASTLQPGTYSVEVQINDQRGALQTRVIPIDVTDANQFSILNRDLSYGSSSLASSVTFTPQVTLRSVGGVGGVVWSLLPRVTTLSLATISGATLNLPLTAIGEWTIGIRATDSVGNTTTRLIAVRVEQPQVVSVVDGNTLIAVSPAISGVGTHQFSVTVTDSALTSVRKSFNYVVNDPISSVDITDTVIDHNWRALDYTSLVFPINGGLSGFTLGGFAPFRAPNGLAVSYDATTQSMVVSGPPSVFQNAEIAVPITILQGTSQVATVTREFTLIANTGQAGMGSMGCYTRPYIVGEMIGLNPQRPYFNSPGIFKAAGYTVHLDTGSILPPGLSLDTTTGLIYGTVLGADVAQSTLIYRDATGALAGIIHVYWDILAGTFQLTDNLPIGQLQAGYSGTIGSNSAAPLTAAMVVRGSLPAGLQLALSTDATHVTLTGNPISAGYVDLWIQVMNSIGQSAYIQKRLIINFIMPLTIATTTLAPPVTGVAWTQTLHAVGGVGPYTWAVATGTLPNGITLNPSSGVLSGTPTDIAYNQTITLQVTDERNVSASASFQFLINSTLRIVSPVLPVVVPSQLYRFQLAAQGGTGGYTWSLASGSLPAGVTLSPSGLLFGATTLESFSVNLVVQVRDSSFNIATQPFQLRTGLPSILEIDTSGCGLIPHGGPYFGSLRVIGGTTGYSWSLGPDTPNQLPTGLTLTADGNGALPTATISGSITDTLVNQAIEVQVVDQGGNTAVAFLMLNSASSMHITTTSLPQGVMNAAYSAQLACTGFNPGFTWTIDRTSQALPAGLTLNSSGLLSGIPTVTANYGIVVRATDSLADYATATLSLIVAASTLQISVPPTMSVRSGAPFSASPSASGGVAPYHWSITAGQLPSGLSQDPDTGVISGTSRVSGFSGSITIRVTDAEGVGVYREATTILTVDSSLTLTAGPDWVQGTNIGYLGIVGQGDPTTISPLNNNSFYVVAQNCVSTAPSGIVCSVPAGYSASVTSLISGTALIQLSGPFSTGSLGDNTFIFSMSDSGVSGANSSKQFKWSVYAEKALAVVTASGGALPTLYLG